MSGTMRLGLPILGPDPAPATRRELAASMQGHGLPIRAQKPRWLKVPVPGGERYQQVKTTLATLGLMPSLAALALRGRAAPAAAAPPSVP